jgi:hypothetical protein
MSDGVGEVSTIRFRNKLIVRRPLGENILVMVIVTELHSEFLRPMLKPLQQSGGIRRRHTSNQK